MLFSSVIVLPVYSVDITVGLLTASNELGEVEKAAYDWANENFQSTILIADDNGIFKDNTGTALKLDEFAVLWFFHTETGTLPDSFLADSTKKAILDYIEDGGGIFLSALSLRYVSDLNIEKGGTPRNLSPLGKGPPEIGIIPTADNKDHPIFNGFDTNEPIFLTSMPQAGFSSDFMNFGATSLTGEVLGTKTRGGGAGAGERPCVEYDVEDGKVITLGHHNGVYTDSNSDEGKNLRNLTANIFNYLAANSKFANVEPNNKLATTWADMKALLK